MKKINKTRDKNSCGYVRWSGFPIAFANESEVRLSREYQDYVTTCSNAKSNIINNNLLDS